MEIAIPAPVAGRVRDVFVARNVQVDAGAPLFRIEPVETADDAGPTGDAHRASTALRHDAADDTAARSAGDRRGVHPRVRRRRAPASSACSPRSVTTPAPTSASCRSSTPSPTVAVVFPERRAPDAEGDEARGAREHFHTFLRSLDVEHEGLPEWYADRLRRAVAPLRRHGAAARAAAGGGAAATVHRPAAPGRAGPRRPRPARRPRGQDARRRPPAARDARPADRGDQAALPRRGVGGADRAPPPLRPSATSSGPEPRCRRGCASSPPLSPATSPTPPTERRSTSSSPARSRSCRSSPRTSCCPGRDEPGAAARGADPPLLQDPRPRRR